jgi:surface protein
VTTLTDLNTKRVELNDAIDAYKQAVLDYAAGTAPLANLNAAKAAAIAKGDEYAKLAGQVKKDDPSQPDADFFSDPILMSESVRSDISEIVRFGSRLGMILVIDTETVAPGNTYAVLSTLGGSNFDIDWGDGTVETLGGGSNHTYATPGVYTVGIKGQIAGFSNPATGHEALITEVKKWGGVQIDSYKDMFRNRIGFTITATDQPLFPNNANVESMFFGANFTGDISFWNMSKVRNANYMFGGDAQFTSDISGWNMSNVTNFSFMFNGSTTFNQDISGWDTSSALNMDIMFYNATAFNQNISGWNVSNVNSHNNFAGGTSILAPANQPTFPV